MNQSGVPIITLNSGVHMPQLGLGVWEAQAGSEVEQAINTALDHGYRMIDTAMIYGNEESVGRALRAYMARTGLPRKELFITTKLWNSDQGYDRALDACHASLQRLGLEYIDLYLIHWPTPKQDLYGESWRALEKLYADGVARTIGVSNFKPHHLERLQETWQTVPAVNQIELHPHFQQLETRRFCEKLDIRIESYSPLKRGGDVLDEPVIRVLADKYGKTPAQIILRWHTQEGLIVIPKSVTPSRIMENIDIFDFELQADDMEQVRGLNRDERLLTDPDAFGWLSMAKLAGRIGSERIIRQWRRTRH